MKPAKPSNNGKNLGKYLHKAKPKPAENGKKQEPATGGVRG